MGQRFFIFLVVTSRSCFTLTVSSAASLSELGGRTKVKMSGLRPSAQYICVVFVLLGHISGALCTATVGATLEQAILNAESHDRARSSATMQIMAFHSPPVMPYSEQLKLEEMSAKDRRVSLLDYLREHAETTQAALVAQLTELNITYSTFVVGNVRQTLFMRGC